MFRQSLVPQQVQVVVCEGQDVRFIAVEDRGMALFISTIEIVSTAQRQGIGTLLIREVCASAAERAIGTELRVLNVNPARALYERLGFTPTKVGETHTTIVWRAKVGA